MPRIVADKQTWEFPEGHEIAPGRTILKLLGGGNRYEVYLVWDDRLFSVMVAKVLRPDLVPPNRLDSAARFAGDDLGNGHGTAPSLTRSHPAARLQLCRTPRAVRAQSIKRNVLTATNNRVRRR